MDSPQEPADNLVEFLDSIIENIPLMIFVKEAKDLRFIRFNHAAEELLGFSKAEMIGKNDYDFFPKNQADFFTEKDIQVLKNRVLVDIPEEPIETKNKGKRVLHTRKIPLLDKEGVPIYLLGISEDITEKKKQADALKTKTEELEQMNKFMVNRELRMSELKEEITKLKAGK
jgi:PAS domain S-box-containing protein